MSGTNRATRLKSPNKNRRQTLGPVPSSSMKNRGESLDVSVGAAKGKSRKPRQSMLPRVGRENAGAPHSPARQSVFTATTASSRRKSVGGAALEHVRNSSTKHRRQTLVPTINSTSSVVNRDPRNINDKALQQQSMKRLLAFLLERGYEYPVSMKTLKMPSGRDFCSITTFVLRRIDPNFMEMRNDLKFEDEVSSTVKALGFPFPISKTALVSAGSPHTWPQLLAMLSWLLDQLEEVETVPLPLEEKTMHGEEDTTVYESIEELQEKSEDRFFKYLGPAYQAFMAGDNAVFEELQEILIENNEQDDQFLEQEIERITDLSAAMAQRINDGDDQSQEIKQWSQKREDYATEVEQYQDLVKQMEDNKASYSQKLEERQKNLAKVNEKAERIKRTIAKLENDITDQELSVDDAKKLQIEHQSQSESLDRVLKKRDEQKQELSAFEAELGKLFVVAESAVTEYNKWISEMSIVPIVGPLYGELKGELKKDFLKGGNQPDFLGADLKGVEQMMEAHQPEVARRMEEKTSEYQDSLDEAQSLENRIKEANVKLGIHTEEHKKFEEMLEQEGSAHEAKLLVRQREVEAMKEKVESLRDPIAMETAIASLESQCADLETLRIRHQEEHEQRKKAVQKEIEDCVGFLQEHEAFVGSVTSQVKDFWGQKMMSLQKIAVPTNMDEDAEASESEAK